jgi:hypothetical protein
MPDLYPTFDVPALVEAEPSTAVRYPKSWLFDMEKGDFVLDGSGRVVEADGLTAWAQWCIKAVSTIRLAYLAYGPNYGCDSGNVERQPNRKAAEAELERVITEALIVDSRTEAIRDFTFRWSGDEVHVSFTAVPVIGDAQRLEVRLNGG